MAISFCLMQELSTQQASSDYLPSLRCVELVVFAYSSDLSRPYVKTVAYFKQFDTSLSLSRRGRRSPRRPLREICASASTSLIQKQKNRVAVFAGTLTLQSPPIHQKRQINKAIGKSPFVVVPCKNLDQLAADDQRRKSVYDGRARIPLVIA